MVLGIVTTILLATAVGSIAAATFMPAGPANALPATGSAETVRRFYAAVNDVIATGDPAAIHAVVAPHFFDAEPLPGVAPGIDGLAAYLTGLHAANPEMRLEVEEVVSAGDRVVARVGVRHAPEGAILGGSVVDQSASWGEVESFRVAGGRIVERRSAVDNLAVVRTLAEGSVAFAALAPRVVTIERFTLAPGARWDAPPVGPRLLVLETGTLQLDLGHARADLDGEQPVMLAEGGSIMAPAVGRHSVTNRGGGEARLLVVTFSVPPTSHYLAAPEEILPSGVSAQTLAGGLATKVGVGSASVSLGRATIGRDARLSLSSADGPVLLAVDDGDLDMAAWGTAWMRRGVDGGSVWTSEATLAAGDGLLLEPGGLAALRGAGTGSVEALILTVWDAPVLPGTPTT
jgi:predicted ester cyclase